MEIGAGGRAPKKAPRTLKDAAGSEGRATEKLTKDTLTSVRIFRLGLEQPTTEMIVQKCNSLVSTPVADYSKR